ncbi:polysaccharide lyase family 8 protein [Crepidotus variabilis]|uniref:Polysaccharide lyase family 8 protein n=1 Tax=Crepidotus variabilis TaxID=179855 RepID=A0A9P6E598_9AGAR|nr:polysaccharide lyase family 8 protein [Crepidotus variabilis]
MVAPRYTSMHCTHLTLTLLFFSTPVLTSNSLTGWAGTTTIGPTSSVAQRQDAVSSMSNIRKGLIVDDITDSPDTVAQWLSTIGNDGKWPAKEIDYTSGCRAQEANWPAQMHWQRILSMTGTYSKSPTDDLRTAISHAIDYWFKNDVTNAACLQEGGGASCPCTDGTFWNKNWFANIIRIPQLVSQSCLLFDASLSSSQKAKCTAISQRSFDYFYQSNPPGFLTGANVLDIAKIGVDLALRRSNATLLRDAYAQVHKDAVVHNATKVDGIRFDGTFGQHAGLLYNGNYGKDYLNDLLDLELVASGTEYEASHEVQDAFTRLFEADSWMLIQDTQAKSKKWDLSVIGRMITFPSADEQATGAVEGLINASRVSFLASAWKKPSISSFASALQTITSSANAGSVVGNRMFFTNDYMVHRGPNYVSTLKMYSTRTLNTECVNAQNPYGFHLSDGALYTYVDGTEYQDIAASWNWNLIPGTTAINSPSLLSTSNLSCDKSKFSGLEPFVGGVSDGTSGIAVMRYTDPSTRALSWQKTWFFLDNDVQHVMISNISGSSVQPGNVVSVLDQRTYSSSKGLFVDDVQVLQNNDGTPSVGPSLPKTPVKANIWHGQVGYSFPSDSISSNKFTPSVSVGIKTGNWSSVGVSAQSPTTVDIFTATITHQDFTAPVEYSVFPGTQDATAFKNRLNALRLFTLSNDQHISAVYDDSFGTAYVVFWDSNGGSVTFTPPASTSITLNATSACAFIYRLKTGSITLADPSQGTGKADVQVTLGGTGSPPPSWPTKPKDVKNISHTFALPSGGMAGLYDYLSQ